MNSFLKNYGSTLALLAGLLIGGVVGVFSPAISHAVKPIGDLFLNLMFVLVVPMVFFSISVSICNMQKSGNVGRLFVTMILVFIGMSVIAGIFSYVATLVYDPLGEVDRSNFSFDIPQGTKNGSVADAVVSSLSVSDFPLLLSKSNLLPLIVFSALLGFAVSAVGEKAQPIEKLLNAGNEVIMKMMSFVMKIAPLGLGCFFANTVNTVGSQLLGGYLRSFLLFVVITLIWFFIANPLYVLIFRGVSGFKAYWANILPPSVVAFATGASALAIPGNIDALKKMGADPDLAEMMIPFGTNVHKDGSVMSGLMKTVFLMLLVGQSITTPEGMFTALGIGILSSIVLGAVTGGMLVGEVLITSLLGLPAEMAGIIIVVGTIVDMPATLLNSSSNVVATLIVDKLNKKKED